MKEKKIDTDVWVPFVIVKEGATRTIAGFKHKIIALES